MSGGRTSGLTSRQVTANGLDFHVRESGAGAPILLLHGFPDHSGVWRPLMERLAGQFRLIAPDQRGYNLTSRPDGVDDYRTDLLVADMIALLDALGLQRVAVCGHDWGGVVAFHLAMRHPDLISHLIALNSAHPFLFQDRIWDDPEQRAASQYFGRLKAGKAPSAFTEQGAAALLESWFSRPLELGQMTQDEVEAYREAWTRPAFGKP